MKKNADLEPKKPVLSDIITDNNNKEETPIEKEDYDKLKNDYNKIMDENNKLKKENEELKNSEAD